jgi:hypothetical protein
MLAMTNTITAPRGSHSNRSLLRGLIRRCIACATLILACDLRRVDPFAGGSSESLADIVTAV